MHNQGPKEARLRQIWQAGSTVISMVAAIIVGLSSAASASGSVRINAPEARYPLTIGPLTQQGGKLTGGGESGQGFFGTSVALSANGNTALVGAEGDASSEGAAWVFTRSGSTWAQQGTKLTPSGRTFGQFGTWAALSADGNTALIGGRFTNHAQGAAWVFSRTGSRWEQDARLTGGGEIGQAYFGQSVALSSDGDTALVGGPQDNRGEGAAWVFTRSGSTWRQQGVKLRGGGEAGSGDFGSSLALSGDGTSALIGGRGAAWLFSRSGTTWDQQGAKLTGGGEAGNDGFGFSVALSGDGTTALIGSPFSASGTGGAWLFSRSGTTWGRQGAQLSGSGETGSGAFGEAVALSGDGTRALVGAGSDHKSIGAVWVFTRSGSTWAQQGSKLTGRGESPARGLSTNGGFGTSVALSSDGTTALVGGPEDNSNTGAVWAFGRLG